MDNRDPSTHPPPDNGIFKNIRYTYNCLSDGRMLIQVSVISMRVPSWWGIAGRRTRLCQDSLAHYWRTSEGILSSTHSRKLATDSSDNDSDAQPSFSLLHRQPQSCLTTEKSRSRTPPALPSSPRRSPTSRAASSCSTRQAHREYCCSATI